MNESNFPNSFRLLIQEAILADSSLLSGFEYLVKGNFDAKGKGAYYAAFFDLTIGFERLMKLVIIIHHMVENDYAPYDPEKLKKEYGHNLAKLYQRCHEIAALYGIQTIDIKKGDLNHQTLEFLTDFADAQKGRYFNITNTTLQNDPIITWQSLLNEIARQDFSEQVFASLETKVFNSINPALQLDDLAHNTGYVESFYKHRKTLLANRYALWRIMSVLGPIAFTLDKIADKCHVIDTTKKPKNYPSIPYFDEVFLFRYTEKKAAMKRKRWTDLLPSLTTE